MKGVSEEMLMAYADGMLPSDEMNEVERIIASDPVAAAKVKKFKQSTVLVKSLGSSLSKLEVGPELLSRVEAMVVQPHVQKDKVVSFPTRAANQNQKQPPIWQVLAAAFVLFTVGIWSGVQIAGQENSQLVSVSATLPSDIMDTLAKLPSGEAQTSASGKVRLIASFKLDDGSFCREFELTPASGPVSTLAIACKTKGLDYSTRMALATSSLTTDYTPASVNETVDAYLSSIGAGSPLSTLEEQDALRK